MHYFQLAIVLWACVVNQLLFATATVQQIPAHERQTLTLFFETLLANNFAYTLFGDKPVSGDCYHITADRSRKATCLRNGQRVWQQYSHLFALEQYALLFQQNGEFEYIFLLNKKASAAALERHLPDFQAVLGSQFEPSTFLTKMCTTDTFYEEALHHHSGLIGILYGFGRDNAFIYYKGQQISSHIEKWLTPPFNFCHDDLTDNEIQEIKENPVAFFSTQKIQIPLELQLLLQERIRFGNPLQEFPPQEDVLSLSSLALFPLPAFGADLHSAETKALFDKYTATRHTIMKAFSRGDFLEVTLCKLTEK